MSDAILELPSLGPDDRLRSVLDAALRAAGQGPAARAVRHDLWDPGFFGLDRTTAWRGASAAAQRQILAAAGRSLLEEAFYIEKCGMAYAAKMALAARSTEERALYGLFAADEARHLMAVSGWLADDAIGAPSAFHHLLADVYEHADPVGAVLIVQVLLEGWGLRHYRDLAGACNDPDLGAVLRGVVSDETRHHGSGVILLSQRALPDDGVERVIDLLTRFLSMVRAGPQGTLAALEHGLGPLCHADRVTTLRELDAEGHSATRLAVLRSLLDLQHAAAVREALEARGLFTPLSPEHAA